MSSLLEALPDATVVASATETVVFASSMATRLFGYTAEEMVGMQLQTLWPEHLRDVYGGLFRSYLDGVYEPRSGPVVGFHALHADGSEVPVEISLSMMDTGDDGSEPLVICSLRPTRSNAPDAKPSRTELVRRSVEATSVPTWVADVKGRMVTANSAFALLLGRSDADLTGIHFRDVTHPEDVERCEAVLAELTSKRRTSLTLEKRYLHADGHAIWVWLVVTAHHDSHGNPTTFVVHAQDVTAQHARYQRLRRRADHDSLTGVLNRGAFDRELGRLLARADRHERHGALLMIDLDHFKRVNDTLGHAAGDEVLEAVGLALTRRLRDEDLAGRLGGDEFAVALDNAEPLTAARVAKALLSAIREAAPPGLPRPTAASIGIAYFDPALTDHTVLLRRADLAMYEAKRAGGNQLAIYRGP